jgi:branched-chain amino acid aminotransferase
MRMAAWRGSEQMGIGAKGLTTRLAVAAWDWGKYFNPGENGISLTTSRWRKPAPDTAPVHSKSSCLYNLCVMAKYEAQEKGYTDALMLDHEGLVAESTGANLFAIGDDVLHTPIADRFLNGITRQTILQLAKELGIKIEERRIKPEELSKFEEIFLTGTAAELTPVGKIDSMEYKVGPVTKKLHKAYQELVSQPQQKK